MKKYKSFWDAAYDMGDPTYVYGEGEDPEEAVKRLRKDVTEGQIRDLIKEFSDDIDSDTEPSEWEGAKGYAIDVLRSLI